MYMRMEVKIVKKRIQIRVKLIFRSHLRRYLVRLIWFCLPFAILIGDFLDDGVINGTFIPLELFL